MINSGGAGTQIIARREQKRKGWLIMAVGKWKVFSQMIEDEKNYIVGRIKDDTKPVHSGNVEYLAGHGYTTDREYCERMAKALNGEFDNPGA